MLRAYKALNAEDFGDGKSLADTGLDKPEATVTVHLKDDAETLRAPRRQRVAPARTAGPSARDDDTIYQITSFASDWATSDSAKFQSAADAGAPGRGQEEVATRPARLSRVGDLRARRRRAGLRPARAKRGARASAPVRRRRGARPRAPTPMRRRPAARAPRVAGRRRRRRPGARAARCAAGVRGDRGGGEEHVVVQRDQSRGLHAALPRARGGRRRSRRARAGVPSSARACPAPPGTAARPGAARRARASMAGRPVPLASSAAAASRASARGGRAEPRRERRRVDGDAEVNLDAAARRARRTTSGGTRAHVLVEADAKLARSPRSRAGTPRGASRRSSG